MFCKPQSLAVRHNPTNEWTVTVFITTDYCTNTPSLKFIEFCRCIFEPADRRSWCLVICPMPNPVQTKPDLWTHTDKERWQNHNYYHSPLVYDRSDSELRAIRTYNLQLAFHSIQVLHTKRFVFYTSKCYVSMTKVSVSPLEWIFGPHWFSTYFRTMMYASIVTLEPFWQLWCLNYSLML